jgi:hypothetical protein
MKVNDFHSNKESMKNSEKGTHTNISNNSHEYDVLGHDMS